MARQAIEGFNYITDKRVSHTRAEWRTIMQESIAAGGRRRAEAGETFIHNGKTNSIDYEIYAIIPAPAADDGSDLI